MKPVDDWQQVRDGLYFWQGYDPSVKVDLSCCALRVGEKLVLVDPIPLARQPLKLLKSEGEPTAIVLTNGNHARASAGYKEQFAIPIYAHVEARGEVAADHWLEDGATLFDELAVIHIPGAAPGEIAIHSPAHGGIVMVGDALINLEPLGFTFLPDKYCTDAKRMKQSLQKLLQFEFEVLTFAHGLPIASNAKRRLEQLLNK